MVTCSNMEHTDLSANTHQLLAEWLWNREKHKLETETSRVWSCGRLWQSIRDLNNHEEEEEEGYSTLYLFATYPTFSNWLGNTSFSLVTCDHQGITDQSLWLTLFQLSEAINNNWKENLINCPAILKGHAQNFWQETTSDKFLLKALASNCFDLIFVPRDIYHTIDIDTGPNTEF